MICYNNQIMTSPEHIQSSSDEASFKFSLSMLDFVKLQSDLMNKFSAPEARFLPETTPHIVNEDLFHVGAVSQPVLGGSYISWNDPRFLGELRDLYTQPFESE